MKKLSLKGLLAIGILAVLLVIPQVYAVEWSTYKNEDVGFSMDVPADWKIDEDVGAYEEGTIGGAMFLSPSEEGPCVFAATEEIEAGQTIRDHVQDDLDEADGTAESWGERTVGGEEAVTTVALLPDGRKSYMIHFWMPGEEGSIVMMIESETDEGCYDDDFDEYFEPMIDSFELL